MMATTSGPTPSIGRLSYVPGELCVVTERAGDASPSNPDARSKQHEDVCVWLNEQLHSHLSSLPAGSRPSGFEADLFPTALVATHRHTTQLLQRLTRTGANPLDHWLELPRQNGQTTTLHFYQIGLEPFRSRYPNRGAHERHVQEAVKLINHHLVHAAPQSTDWRLLGATPNWLMATAQNDWTTGGPAACPAAAPAGEWQFRFRNPALDELATKEQNADGLSDIVVAVVDTSPSRRQVDAALQRYKGNALLQKVADPDRLKLEGDMCLDDHHFSHLGECVAGWGAWLHNPANAARAHELSFEMADHGLFVSGVIRQIAPRAEVILVRALSNYGVGDLYSLVHTLKRVHDYVQGQHKRLIVNLSLTAGLAPKGKLLQHWFPATFQDASAPIGYASDLDAYVDALHQSLAHIVDWLVERDVLIVAAAGNDALHVAHRPEPDLPARYDDVFGVAAVRRDSSEPSAFSNRGDMVVMGNGIAVLGGNAAEQEGGPPRITFAGSDEVVTDTQRAEPGSVDAIAGVFSAPELPFGGGSNGTGCVYWSGTSFATPIISAIAADQWAGDLNQSPTAVLRAVRGFASGHSRALGCPVISVDQTP